MKMSYYRRVLIYGWSGILSLTEGSSICVSHRETLINTSKYTQSKPKLSTGHYVDDTDDHHIFICHLVSVYLILLSYVRTMSGVTAQGQLLYCNLALLRVKALLRDLTQTWVFH